MTSTIGTFVITSKRDMWNARDKDAFNNWGEYTCPTRVECEAWADWAHRFKTGRTFSEFDHAKYRMADANSPVKTFAARSF